MGEIVVNNYLYVPADYRAPNLMDVNCSDFLDFSFSNDSLNAELQSEIDYFVCTFDIYNKTFTSDTNGDRTNYTSLFFLGNVTEDFIDAFKAGEVNMTFRNDTPLCLNCT